MVGGEPLIGGFLSKRGLIVGVLMVLGIAGLFHDFLWAQNGYSYGKAGDWSHAYMVPFISGYLLWQRRGDLSRIKVGPFWPGLILVMLSIATYVFFLVGVPNHMGQGWSMVLCTFGVTLLLCGPSVAQIAVVPIGYLVLGITVSEKIMIELTWPLQILAAQGADVLLNIIGVECVREGNQLTVVNSAGVKCPLNVAEACSGMRMVIAFIALGVAIGLVAVKPWWQRVFLMVMGVPVALLMNIFRVAVLGVLSLYDPEYSKGGAHMMIGTVLLVPGFVLYLGLVWAIKRAVVVSDVEKAAVPTSGLRAGPRAGRLWPAVLTGMAVLGIAAVGLSTAVSAMGLYLRKLPIHAPENRKVSAIASDTPSWSRVGNDSQMSAEVVDELGTENYLSRVYAAASKDGPGKRVELHLAYYTGMIDTVPHVPERCIVGAGWLIVGSPTNVEIKVNTSRFEPVVGENLGEGVVLRTAQGVTMPRDLDKLSMRVTEFAGPEGRKLFAGYFFLANGGHESSPEGVRQLAFKLEDTYAYFLKVQFSSADVRTRDELAQAAGSMLDELLPDIMRSVPDWIEVQQGRYPLDNPRGKKADAPVGR